MNDTVKEKMNPDFPFGMKYIHPDFRIGCDEFTLTQAEEGLRAVHVLDQFVWIRVMEGQLSFEVNMQEITLSTGDTLFINSRVPHICRTVIAAPARVRILIAAPDAVHVSYLENMLSAMINDSGFSSAVIHPVSDLFYYGAAIICMAAVLISFIDLIKCHNRAATRALPQFKMYQGGDHSA